MYGAIACLVRKMVTQLLGEDRVGKVELVVGSLGVGFGLSGQGGDDDATDRPAAFLSAVRGRFPQLAETPDEALSPFADEFRVMMARA
jgi:hypothetical protein